MKDNFMPSTPLTTPILFMVFNRPDTTQKVFNTIRQAKPKKLFIAADGPRPGKEGELEKCKKVREIAASVDWDCEVKMLFRDKNLGCKIAISYAIDWFFENTEEGIIREDDYLPSQSFFWFCQELLKKYRDVKNIGIISGSNYFFGEKDTEEDYYFSVFPFIWGWASWKHVWKQYDIKMIDWPIFKKNKGFHDLFCSNACIEYWERSFDQTYNAIIDTWDYQFTFMLCNNHFLNISPTLNLISNIGVGDDASHTKGKKSKHANMPRYELRLPLIHQENILRSLRLDKKFEKQAFHKNVLKKTLSRLKLWLVKFIVIIKESF